MKKYLLLACLLSLPSFAGAETIRIGVGQQSSGDSAMKRPQPGSSMEQVEEKFGSPEDENTVGEPPITTWRYDSFTVYFEGERVLRAVLHKKNMDK
ncbi:outer membrane protein assembly factor BamE [Aestuariirhabdus sp. Z084]|uniref:outer membrane protein assembly factor BamE n=1 Tax=Aestuariirhabdus haliotis TaxID=2918751 RepID=UPI00201B3A14|nr:outer membrane protein assembly factor BamE [Aestuariirhabdus haliotis]MCL6414773.1 outer membrane protein assembly factor BamE [Aestuariirhabdus haliotis]MCL6418705.1 outer membrane protein assembly factor BamE [Aestuariirhabdus haliotis]